MDRLASMEVFVRVVDTGSFSAAARQLRVGQPAVSKTIAQLEDRLGIQLLLRSTRGLSTTEAGQTFYEHARRSIEAADEAELAARGAKSGLTGRLRFSAAVTFARLHIIPHLGDFLAAHPALAIEAVLDDRNVDLLEEGIDVGLRMGELPPSSLTARRIGRLQRQVIGTPAYFAAKGMPKKPTDLKQHRAVIYALGGGGNQWRFTKGGKTIDVTLADDFRITAAEGLREAVFAGIGLCVSTVGMFQSELGSGQVVAALTEWQLPQLDFSAVYPGGRRISAKAQAFTRFIEARLEASGLLVA